MTSLPTRADLAAAQPTLLVQLIDICVAMVAVLIIMQIGSRLLRQLFRNVGRFRMAKERELCQIFAGTKGDLGDPEGEFREFCSKNFAYVEDFAAWRARQTTEIAAAGQQADQDAIDSLLQHKHAIDAYLDEDASNKEAFSEFACYRSANNLMLYLQHGIAGILGLIALRQASDEDFQIFARWGILFEAGWELSDWFTYIIPSMAKGRGAKAIPMIIHHMCLYAWLPTNLYAIQGPLGRYVAWSLVTMAGSIGPTSVLMLFKDILNDKNTVERWIGRGILLCVIIILLTIRGPVWWWLAYNFVVKSQQLGTAVHILFCVLAVLFQLFNIIFYLIAFTFAKDLVAPPADAEEEERAKRAFGKALAEKLNPGYAVNPRKIAEKHIGLRRPLLVENAYADPEEPAEEVSWGCFGCFGRTRGVE